MSDDTSQVSSEPNFQKSELRRRMEMLRAEAFAKNKRAPFGLRDQFYKNIILYPGCTVASYRARGSEMDPAPLTEALQKGGHVIALPVVAEKGKPLEFRRANPGDRLALNVYGIEEPGPDAPLIEPDVLLVPLLAFDRSGARLGMGGGHYDRTIASLRERGRILAVGIGFSCQELSTVPTDPHDIILDRIATETQVF
jgi:5-formyltetrahydrofolate cyclo-ligase